MAEEWSRVWASSSEPVSLGLLGAPWAEALAPATDLDGAPPAPT